MTSAQMHSRAETTQMEERKFRRLTSLDCPWGPRMGSLSHGRFRHARVVPSRAHLELELPSRGGGSQNWSISSLGRLEQRE